VIHELGTAALIRSSIAITYVACVPPPLLPVTPIRPASTSGRLIR